MYCMLLLVRELARHLFQLQTELNIFQIANRYFEEFCCVFICFRDGNNKKQHEERERNVEILKIKEINNRTTLY